MTNLPTRTTRFIPYEPDVDRFPDLCDDDHPDENLRDYRFYEIVNGEKRFLNHHTRVVHENGETQCEGTFVNGLKAGIWRFFNENGVLINSGRYNRENERWGKWRFYGELNGKSCLQMIVDIRGDHEHYWVYNMDGELEHEHTVSNLYAPIEDHNYETRFYRPSDRSWPPTYK